MKKRLFLRQNFSESDNRNYRDGDIESTRQYDKDKNSIVNNPDSRSESTLMYDAPNQPNSIKDPDGKINRNIDKVNSRTSLITDEVRVYKGGSWKDRAYWLDPAQRRYLPQYIATDYIGFRCAMSRLGQKSKIKKTARHKRGR
jgi:gliding motility-associated lipoprotein GldJ